MTVLQGIVAGIRERGDQIVAAGRGGFLGFLVDAARRKTMR